MGGVDWDDLRYFLAVARAGTLTDAAHTLAVSYSTVSRRINALEEGMGSRLFERHASGYELTSAGREMLESGRRMEAEFESLSRQVQGRDRRLAGAVRMATTDALATAFMPEVAEFTQRYPGIEIDLIATPEPSELAMREADVALLVCAAPAESLTGRRLAILQSALYASRSYLERSPDVDRLDGHVWVGWEKGMSHIPVARWMREHVPEAKLACRVSTGTALRAAVRAGVGVAHMLCFLAEGDSEFVQLSASEPELETGLWLLTHEDLKTTARIRVLLDFFAEAIGKKRDGLLASDAAFAQA